MSSPNVLAQRSNLIPLPPMILHTIRCGWCVISAPCSYVARITINWVRNSKGLVPNCSQIHCQGFCAASGKNRFCGLVVRLPSCRLRGPGFDSQRCQIFWVAVDLERCPLSPCEGKWGSTWKKSSDSGLDNWDWRLWGIRRADHATPVYPQIWN
jgi:hypothetical protein